TIHVLQGEREMAADNRTLGKFDLVGIPPAPRGVPQIEVSFDIDANGILHVSAKDLGTGKEQEIRIEASSGLSEEEIQRMVREAEQHAEEDKRRKKLIEARNSADTAVYSAEKSLKEFGDKIGAADREAIEKAIEKVKEAAKGEDTNAIEQAISELGRATQKIGEIMYAEAVKKQQAAGASAGDATSGQSSGASDETIDANYKVVDDDPKNN
ncbi:MAG TPA: Hsp70 family protein, partial [Candidatus Hydrogenedentes bacterium]|nr:Hsp70 family protein [Candidatus Hydrogenedentota bacterium]